MCGNMLRMAWEWAPPAIAVATTAIAVGATLGATRMGHRHAERLTNARLVHERELAADARRQQRLSEAYVELLEVVGGVGYWSSSLYPMIDTDPPRELPPLPPLEKQLRAQALVSAYGSDTVRELHRTWTSTMVQIRAAAQTIGHMRAEIEKRKTDLGVGRFADVEAAQRQKLELEYRPAEQAAREALARQLSLELGDRVADPPTATDDMPS
jgi:hypothetical protein